MSTGRVRMGRVRVAKPPCPLESDERKAIVRFARAWTPVHPDLGFLIGNFNEFKFLSMVPVNMFRAIASAKSQGHQDGIPDLFLPVARRGFHGLWIEVKRLRGGQVKPEQRWWHEALRNLGHFVLVSKGAQPGCDALIWYVSEKKGIGGTAA